MYPNEGPLFPIKGRIKVSSWINQPTFVITQLVCSEFHRVAYRIRHSTTSINNIAHACTDWQYDPCHEEGTRWILPMCLMLRVESKTLIKESESNSTWTIQNHHTRPMLQDLILNRNMHNPYIQKKHVTMNSGNDDSKLTIWFYMLSSSLPNGLKESASNPSQEK